METTPVVEEFTASSDQNPPILKGKRTKRHRPFGAAATSSSCSAGAGAGDVNYSNPSPTTSGEFSTTTEEEEDMANCLILLAQGAAPQKQSRRRFSESKVGMFVYECKTCNRTFPSFQALGGHRASHKKPKLSSMPDDKKLVLIPIPKSSSSSSQSQSQNYDQLPISPPTADELMFGKISQLPISPPPPPLTASKPLKTKIHECSICGSEFSSGQALGGHMRRHRTNTTPASTQPQLPMVIDTTIDTQQDKPRHVLTLDLNLPAPPDSDDGNFQFRPTQQQQQQHLIFSSPALVDCHY